MAISIAMAISMINVKNDNYDLSAI